MLTLALDTSGDVCSLAISEGDAVLSSLAFRHNRRLSERLPGAVAFLLSDIGYALADVEAFAVGLGPGSFTGVRIGVTMAKLWAHALQKPLIGVSSLDALVEPLGELAAGLVVAAVAPTRRTEVVAAFYRDGFIPLAPPAVIANDNVVASARAFVQNHEPSAALPVLLVGEVAFLVRAETPDAFTRNVLVRAAPPLADAVARLAAPRLARADFDDAFTLTPLYVTPSPVG